MHQINLLNYGPSLDEVSKLWQDQPVVAAQHASQFTVAERASTQTFGLCDSPSITPITYDQSLFVIQSMSFIYPVVTDCETMGRIACTAALSPLYAKGVTEVDSVLMLFAVPRAMPAEERKLVLTEIGTSFQKCLKNDAKAKMAGGQTIINPWLLCGGSCTAVCHKSEVIRPGAIANHDALILTKPLALWACVYAFEQCISSMSDLPANVMDKHRKTYERAKQFLCQLNRNSASRLLKYNCHGAVPLDAGGLYRAASNLHRYNFDHAISEKEQCFEFVVDNLPVLRNFCQMSEMLDSSISLHSGTIPEPSGGLLIAMPLPQAKMFCVEMLREFGERCWVVGRVKLRETVPDDIEHDDALTIPEQAHIFEVDL